MLYWIIDVSGTLIQLLTSNEMKVKIKSRHIKLNIVIVISIKLG
ncbi:hypothetical protein MBGDF03_01106 [Thermoplasmatales archaeon SCGC AB-540-F20]|nr:hypothetical protein MBGDF03_01106 [Thermoplasmatales archaeon SCGC AB-540-F20]